MRNLYICAFLLFAHVGYAQTVINLRPYVGLQGCFSRIKNNSQGASTFRHNIYEEYADFGIFLEAYRNNKVAVSVGATYGLAGFSYKLTIPNPRNPFGSPEKRIASARDVYRIPVKFSYVWKNVSWFPVRYDKKNRRMYLHEQDEDNPLYLLNFQVECFAGVSYNRIRTGNEDALIIESAIQDPYGDTIVTNFDRKIDQVNGLSVFGGITLQFMHYDKQRLALTLYYNQGLLNQMDVDVFYTLNGQSYQTQLGTRGTTVGINVSYPIRLKTFKNKP